MSWYRRYRPSTLSGLHTVSVRDQLSQLAKKGDFPHALLFVGPRGAGKTSTARIIAALLNDPKNQPGQPYQEPDVSVESIRRIHEGSSLAVQELDAASHRGIDDVRALKERAHIPPQDGQALVFILDEVHMLTTEAFNALLKLLEEPPAYVYFILATTEEQKVPATILSRCTLIRFHKASPQEIVAALTPIVAAEHLSIDPSALELLSQSVDGSYRDAVKLLETVSQSHTGSTITHADVLKHLSGVPHQRIETFLSLVLEKDMHGLVSFFAQLRTDGVHEGAFTQSLLQTLHRQLTESIVAPESAVRQLKITHFLLAQFASLEQVSAPRSIPFLDVEIKTFDILLKSKDQRTGSEPPTTGSSTHSSSASTKQSPSTQAKKETTAARPAASTNSVKANKDLAQKLLEAWPRFIEELGRRNGSIGAIFRSAKQSLSDTGCIDLEVYYTFHRDQLQQPKVQQLVDQVVSEVVNDLVLFSYTVAPSHQVSASLSNISTPDTSQPQTSQLVELAQEVFM